jgi:TPR repeat protein
VGKGISYYQRAAEAGHGRAAAVLGVVYARGDDVSADDDKARTFFSLAEELGFDWETLAEAQGLKPERYVTN